MINKYIESNFQSLSTSIANNTNEIKKLLNIIQNDSEIIRELQLKVTQLYNSFGSIQFLSGPSPSNYNGQFGINANLNYYSFLLKSVKTQYINFLPTMIFKSPRVAYEINILAGAYFSNLSYFSITPYIYSSNYTGSSLPYQSWIAMGLNSQMYYTRFPQHLSDSSIISVIISFSYEYNEYFIQNINTNAFSIVLPSDLISNSNFLFILRTSSSFNQYISNEISIQQYNVSSSYTLTPLMSSSTSSNSSIQNIISSTPYAIPVYSSVLVSLFNEAFQTLLSKLSSVFFIIPVFGYYSFENNNIPITSFFSQILNNSSYASQLPSPQENNFLSSYIPIQIIVSKDTTLVLESITVLYINPIAIQVGLAGSIGIYTNNRIEIFTQNTAEIKETMVSTSYPTTNYPVPTYNFNQNTIFMSELNISEQDLAIVIAERQSFPACNQMNNVPEILAANYPTTETSNNLQPNSEILGITIPPTSILWANEKGIVLNPSTTPIIPNVSLTLPQANANCTTNFKVFAKYKSLSNISSVIQNT